MASIPAGGESEESLGEILRSAEQRCFRLWLCRPEPLHSNVFASSWPQPRQMASHEARINWLNRSTFGCFVHDSSGHASRESRPQHPLTYWRCQMAGAAEVLVSIVLVHGGFVDGSGWDQVYKMLKKDGYSVSVVQNPTSSLADDVAATKRVLSGETKPGILVGHSYGGAVITEAGNDPKVAGLVYIAAFAPDKGES